MMQHREAHDGIERRVVERHRGRIAGHDAHPLVELIGQPHRRRLVDLERGQPVQPLGEHSRRGAKAGTDLEHLAGQFDVRQCPRQQRLLD
jgi:hypothetical protein